MSDDGLKGKKMSMMALILMIFTSVFGFANIPRGFYLMGYAAVPWYIISAILFFIPYAFMQAEYGAAFKNEKGGIYSWMDKSVGPKYAFIGTFMWYASYIVWMVNICSAIWIPFANAISGTDTTVNWSIFGLNSTRTLGVLGILLIIAITFIATKGLEQITKVTSIGGTAVALLNIVLLIGAVVVLILNGGKLAEPIVSYESFLYSPNPAYKTTIAMLSFSVFAIFAYGGIEAVGGLVDQTENPEVVFPKGLSIAAIIISIGYSLGVLLIGIFTNWGQTLSTKNVHLGNVAYVVMKNLGYAIGTSVGLSEAVSLNIGLWVARFVGISMFLALIGAFFTLSYSPLKQLIEGTPKELWPGKLSVITDGMPKNAMWVQCVIVAVFIAIVCFGGECAAEFFEKLVLMTNVAMTLPYMFLSGAFARFKRIENIDRPFVAYKSHASSLVATVVVTLTVLFANIFTIVEPATRGDMSSTIFMIAGPLFFTIVALVMYQRYERKYLK